MPHFAKLNSNNVVLEINVISQEDVDANGGDYSAQAENWVKSKWDAYAWKQCSYNANQRGNFPGIGWSWDASINKFKPPQPHNNWTWNNTHNHWEAPVTKPATDNFIESNGDETIIGTIYWDSSNNRWAGRNDDLSTFTRTDYYWNTSQNKWLKQ